MEGKLGYTVFKETKGLEGISRVDQWVKNRKKKCWQAPHYSQSHPNQCHVFLCQWYDIDKQVETK